MFESVLRRSVWKNKFEMTYVGPSQVFLIILRINNFFFYIPFTCLFYLYVRLNQTGLRLVANCRTFDVIGFV